MSPEQRTRPRRAGRPGVAAAGAATGLCVLMGTLSRSISAVRTNMETVPTAHPRVTLGASAGAGSSEVSGRVTKGKKQKAPATQVCGRRGGALALPLSRYVPTRSAAGEVAIPHSQSLSALRLHRPSSPVTLEWSGWLCTRQAWGVAQGSATAPLLPRASLASLSSTVGLLFGGVVVFLLVSRC